MDNDPHNELYNSLKSQLEALRERIHELETENAKLSSQLSDCVCQKIAESDNTHVLDSDQSIGGMEKLRLHNNDVRNTSKEALRGGDAINMRHLPKRYVALKVMYFGERFYGFASEAHMDPTIESEIFKALRRTKLIFGDKKELQYYRCGRTDKGVSSVGQHSSSLLKKDDLMLGSLSSKHVSRVCDGLQQRSHRGLLFLCLVSFAELVPLAARAELSSGG